MSHNNEVFAVLTEQDYGSLQLGYIYSKNKFSNPRLTSFNRNILPKFSNYEKNMHFTRTPLLLSTETVTDNIQLKFINLHQKSVSVRSGFDKAGYAFEVERVRSAAGIREIYEEAVRTKGLKNIVVLGDFNAQMESASVKIIRGVIDASDFKSGNCILMETGEVECERKIQRKPDLYSLMNFSDYSDKQKNQGKYKYRFIDNILMNHIKSSSLSLNDSGYINPEIGISDHPLLWAEIKIN